MGITAQRVCQFGKETVWGTSVAATAIAMTGWMVNSSTVIANTRRRYLRGDFSPAHAVVQTDTRGMATLGGDYCHEDFIYLLLSGVKGAVTPTGAGAAKTWLFPFPTTATAAVESRTLEMSDQTQEWELAGGVVESFGLNSGDGLDATVRFSSNWIGKSVTASTITGALSARTVEPLAAAKMALWLDDIAGTIGTTSITSTLISWDFQYTTGVHMKKFQDAALTPAAIGYAVPDWTLQLTLEYNASADTMADKYVAGTGRLVRLRGAGSAISGGGNKQLTLDLAGDIESINPLWDDRDGNTITTVTLKPRYDLGAFASYGKIEIVNDIAVVIG